MSNKITLAQVHTMLTSVVDEVIALKDRLSVVQQHIGGVDATINSTLGRMDAIESTVANVVAAIADMKPTEPFTQPVIEAQVIQPAHVLAQPVIENGKLADLLCELSTEDLRKMSGLILAELKRRSKTASEQGSRRTTAATTPAPTAKEVDKAAAKEAYLSKKAEYVSRVFGVVCVLTGKQLKRRFADEADALAAAAGLSASMKRPYNVVQIAA